MSDTVVAPAPVSTRRERVGWYFYDWANSAFSTTVIAVFLSPYLTEIAKAATGCATDEACGAARLYPLGVPVSPLSFYSYVLSLSVLLQVVVLPVVGAFTDRTRHRKKLLALFAYVGALSTIGFFFVTGSNYLLGGALFLIANVAFGASVVVYNSYLPALGGPDERDRISSIGWAMGYLGGGLLLVINLAAYVFAPEGLTGLIVRISLASAGVWWAVFSTLPLVMLKDPEPHQIVRASGSAFSGGFRQLGQTLRELRSYPLTLLFLKSATRAPRGWGRWSSGSPCRRPASTRSRSSRSCRSSCSASWRCCSSRSVAPSSRPATRHPGCCRPAGRSLPAPGHPGRPATLHDHREAERRFPRDACLTAITDRGHGEADRSSRRGDRLTAIITTVTLGRVARGGGGAGTAPGSGSRPPSRRRCPRSPPAHPRGRSRRSRRGR